MNWKFWKKKPCKHECDQLLIEEYSLSAPRYVVDSNNALGVNIMIEVCECNGKFQCSSCGAVRVATQYRHEPIGLIDDEDFDVDE